MSEDLEEILQLGNQGDIQTLVFGSMISLSHSLLPESFIYTDGLI